MEEDIKRQEMFLQVILSVVFVLFIVFLVPPDKIIEAITKGLSIIFNDVGMICGEIITTFHSFFHSFIALVKAVIVLIYHQVPSFVLGGIFWRLIIWLEQKQNTIGVLSIALVSFTSIYLIAKFPILITAPFIGFFAITYISLFEANIKKLNGKNQQEQKSPAIDGPWVGGELNDENIT